MDRICIMHGRDEKWLQNFRLETSKRKTAWDDNITIERREIGCEGVNWIQSLV
jgi:hypothetical protein